MPLDTGSTIVRVMAVAMAASTALPPCASIPRPAWAASGCDVHTTFSATMGLRGQAYGKVQSKGAVTTASVTRQAVSSGAIQVSSAGNCELQNDPS